MEIINFEDAKMQRQSKTRNQSMHELEENKYYLYTFGKGCLRRLQPKKFDSVELAKNKAYRTYSSEMERIKKAVDYLAADDGYSSSAAK